MSVDRFREVVDLGLTVSVENPAVYPGTPRPSRVSSATTQNKGFNSYIWTIGDHTATHVDVPHHIVDSNLSVERVPLNRFIGRGVVLDFGLKPRYQITGEDVSRAIRNSIANGRVGEGWIVLFYFGYTSKFGTSEWLEHPDLTKDACEFIIKSGIRAIGMDAPSPDHAPWEPHHILLPANVIIYENLNNLDRLLNKEFLFVGVPLALEGSSAGLVRPLAFVT